MKKNLSKYIDHAVLHPLATDEDLLKACLMCKQLKVATVCVKPYMVNSAAKLLKNSFVDVSTVIGFPHGNMHMRLKAIEAKQACNDGAVELDVVINLGKVIDCSWQYVQNEIINIVQIGHEKNALVKIIFECGLLPDDEYKKKLCEISCKAKTDFVKTSTGFGFIKDAYGKIYCTGATIHDVKLMKKYCCNKVGIKASGGIKTYDDAIAFINAGATRIGTNATKNILK